MLFSRWLLLVAVVPSIGFAVSAGRVAAQEPAGSGQPSNRIGLVKDHKPVKYEGYVLYFVDGELKADDKLTQTWSIIPRKEGKCEHAFKIETHAIHCDADDGNSSFLPQNLFKKDFENSVKYELFHQEEDGDLVLDAIDIDGKPEKIDHETEHYLYPGTLKIGTKWLSQPVISTVRGASQMEVIGSEIYKGTKCWVISSTRQQEKSPLIKNSETVSRSTRFLFDPLTLSVLRVDSVTEGLGPLGRAFRFVYHMEAAE